MRQDKLIIEEHKKITQTKNNTRY